MKLMEPMKPIEPMAPAARWWPERLGHPSTSGGQNEMRYAFFPAERLLMVDVAGTVTAYDSGEHRISGVAQQQSRDQTLTFHSESGEIDLASLKQVDSLR